MLQKEGIMNNWGLLILRVVPATFMLFAHGWGKLTNFSSVVTQFPDPIGLGAPFALSMAIGAEVVCAALLILGIATKLASIPLLITMLVAAFIVHANDPWMKQEFPLLYAVIFLTLIFTGGGAYSLGTRFKSRWLK